jgi:cytosine/uracil/thiamine/allantoin permease
VVAVPTLFDAIYTYARFVAFGLAFLLYLLMTLRPGRRAALASR